MRHFFLSIPHFAFESFDQNSIRNVKMGLVYASITFLAFINFCVLCSPFRREKKFRKKREERKIVPKA